MNCRDCGNRATRRVVISKKGGGRESYVCCDNCEPRHIPQGDDMVISTSPLR